ncbi:endonuclease domain-containing protein [Paractinoplanes globisporus]|uniref:Endonuclease domain-containing protein n=1 Tax=Paractinoplanes globisporus TaxID=113565 RepID=A0ABW6W8D1_9ACTN
MRGPSSVRPEHGDHDLRTSSVRGILCSNCDGVPGEWAPVRTRI